MLTLQDNTAAVEDINDMLANLSSTSAIEDKNDMLTNKDNTWLQDNDPFLRCCTEI